MGVGWGHDVGVDTARDTPGSVILEDVVGFEVDADLAVDVEEDALEVDLDEVEITFTDEVVVLAVDFDVDVDFAVDFVVEVIEEEEQAPQLTSNIKL